MSNNVDLLKRLLKAIDETDVSELTYEENGVKIQLKRGYGAAPIQPVFHHTPVPLHRPVVAEMAAPAAEKEKVSVAAEKARDGKYRSVTSPFVGTFYRSPAPTAPVFVQEGQEVHPGDVLCIVEAMKLMNEIECECHARVAKIQVNNGTPVEFGQELFLLEPLA